MRRMVAYLYLSAVGESVLMTLTELKGWGRFGISLISEGRRKLRQRSTAGGISLVFVSYNCEPS